MKLSKLKLPFFVFVGIISLAAIVLYVNRYLYRTRAAGTTFIVPPSIPSDCSVDVTVAILDWIKTVPDSSTLTFTQNGCYKIEGVLYIYNRNNLVIEGNGATFQAFTDGSALPPPSETSAQFLKPLWPRARSHWVTHFGSNITLRNMTVKGANPKAGPTNDAFEVTLEAQHGFLLASTKGVLLENVTVNDTYGDLVSLSRGVDSAIVRNNRLERSGRQGVTVDGATNVVVENNTITQIGRSVIDIEPPTGTGIVKNVKVVNNNIGRALLTFIAAYGRGQIVDDITVEGNTLTGGQQMTVLVKSDPKDLTKRRKNWKILNNTTDRVFGSPAAPMRFTRVDNIEIKGNTNYIASSQGCLAVRLTDSTTAVIQSNDFQSTPPRPNTSDCAATTVLEADSLSSGYYECDNQVSATQRTAACVTSPSINTPTPSLLPTYAPSPTPTPIPILNPLPTAIIAPTPTPVPGGTTLSMNLLLHGIGRGGDSANPGSAGNTSPKRVQRNVVVEVLNNQNQLVLTKSGVVMFNASGGNFLGTVDLGSALPTGVYTVKVKTDQFLKALVPGIQNLTQGQTTILPQTTLVTGDMNNDNKINILDYNILIDCYSDLSPARNCSDANKKLSADLTDDGDVNQFDYNLFLRELTNVSGE